MGSPYRFYTYAYLREDRTPFYIGKGTGNRAYKKYKGDIKPPKDKSRIIFLKKNLTEEDAFRHEKYMIAVFGRKDIGTGILLNKTDGGEGGSGRIPWNKGKSLSDETKEKIKNSLIGFKHSEETKEKWRNARGGEKHPLYKKGHSEETKKKISESRKGLKLSQENVIKVRNAILKRTAKIYEVTLPDGTVEIFFNLVEISNKYTDLNLDPNTLSKVALGKVKSHRNVKVRILKNELFY